MARKNHGTKRRTRRPQKVALNKKGTRFRPHKEYYYQVQGVYHLEQAGWKVYVTSEPRARAGISPGLPDVLAFHPGTGRLLFWEAKRPTALDENDAEVWAKAPTEYMSLEQREFRDLVATVTEKPIHITGALEAVMRFLQVNDEVSEGEDDEDPR